MMLGPSGGAPAHPIPRPLQATLSVVLDAWCEFMARRVDILQLADLASERRSQRLLSEVLSVWHAYTLAMRAELDAASPFLSPRSPQVDRQLMRHVAASLGGVDKEVGGWWINSWGRWGRWGEALAVLLVDTEKHDANGN